MTSHGGCPNVFADLFEEEEWFGQDTSSAARSRERQVCLRIVDLGLAWGRRRCGRWMLAAGLASALGTVISGEVTGRKGARLMDAQVAVRTEADCTIVTVVGEIDVYSAPQLRQALVDVVS